jgi:hypothetical protein
VRNHDPPSEFARPKEQSLRQPQFGKPPLQERIRQAKDNGCRGEQADAADREPGREQHRCGVNCDARRMQARDETDRALIAKTPAKLAFFGG